MDTGLKRVPPGLPWELDDILQNFRAVLAHLQDALIPPGYVSNFAVTPAAGANIIGFTRSDGTNYVLYVNTTPSINGSTRIELGQANRYTDNLGQGAVKRYYAVKAKKGAVQGDVGPWVSGTTLALGTAITTPIAPPSTELPFTDQQTEAIEIGVPESADMEII